MLMKPWFCVLIGWMLSFSAAAQSLGGKPIRIVVPFGAGAVQDTLARSFNGELGAALGTSAIVENRAGAGGTIGTAAVAKSAPDGTTLILAAASHTINGSLYTKLAYHPIKDFVGVALIGNSGYVLMTDTATPAKNVAEFVAFAKSKPGALNYASAGNGSATHLSMAYFASSAGLDMVHVPFKSTGEAVNEVLAGRAQAVIAANIGALPFTKDSRVRLLAVTSAIRSRFLPELPTVRESGVASLANYEFDTWFGLLAPAGTPREIVTRINAEMAKLLRDPLILDRLAKQGVEPQSASPEEFDRLLQANFERMAKVVKASGATID